MYFIKARRSTLLIKAILTWVMLLTTYNLVRLASPSFGIDLNIFGLIGNLINGMFFIFVALRVMIDIERRNTIHPFILIAFAIIVYILMVGFSNENTGEKWKHAYIVIFAAVTMTYGTQFSKNKIKINLKPVIKFGFYTNILTTLTYLFSTSFIFIYPGYGTQTMAYIVIFFIVHGNILYVIPSIIILISQGKRGVLAATLFCIMLHVVSNSKSNTKLRFIISIAIAILTLIYVLFLIDYFDLYVIPGLSRIAYINPFSQTFDLSIGSSGRFDELTSAFSVFNQEVKNYFFGMGAGFSYEWTLSYREDYSEIKGYVHLSPAFMVLLFGPVITILFYTLTLYFLVNSLKISMLNNDKIHQFFVFSSFLFLILGLFSLNIIGDIFGWLCIGLSYGYLSRSNHVRNI